MKTILRNTMKNINTNLNQLKSIFILAILIIIAACSKDEAEPSPIVQNPTTGFTISSILPSSGAKNTNVLLTGTGFSNTVAENIVTINGKSCTVNSASTTQINITIPPSAGSGKIKVAVGSNNAESTVFEFINTFLVSTYVGTVRGFADGQGGIEKFAIPIATVFDNAGNMYVADIFNHKIRKVTPSRLVSTFAGSTNGFQDAVGTDAKFSFPNCITIDNAGNLYVADANDKIRKITPSGSVSTFAGSTAGFADGPGAVAKFNGINALAVDNAGNLFVSDSSNHCIRKVATTGLVTTFAGSSRGFAEGQGTAAQFNFPVGIAIDASNNIIVADGVNRRIRKISQTGLVSTIAGGTEGNSDGQGNTAQFQVLSGVVVDATGNIYVSDNLSHRIRKITATGLVTTIAGTTEGDTDGNVAVAKFRNPALLSLDAQGNIYVADGQNHKIRKITID